MKNNLKKCAYIIFTAAFILICLPLGASVFYSKGNADTEKKELAPLPSFLDENGSLNSNFDSQLSEYISQRIMLREKILTSHAKLKDLFFKSSAEEQVIIGKDGWLFFEQTVDNYSDLNALSGRGIFNILDTLEQINNYCMENNVEFVFTVAPNKNTLFSHYMPSRYIKSNENNLTRLTKSLSESGINYVNLKALFLSRGGEILYYKTDTHWNNEGALLAYKGLLDALEKPHEAYENTARNIEKTWSGDLLTMLYPGTNEYENEVKFEYDFSFSYTRRLKSPEDINIETANENAQGSLLMFRDSFANSLLPFLSQAFANAFYTRAVPCDLNLIGNYAADTLIYEIAERNLVNIINRAPVMIAKAESLNLESTAQDANVDIRIINGEYAHFYGSVDENILGEKSKIYLVLSDENGASFYYRCFNAYETALLQDNEYRDNGFSVYIDSQNITNKNYKLSIMIETDGEYKIVNTNKTTEELN